MTNKAAADALLEGQLINNSISVLARAIAETILRCQKPGGDVEVMRVPVGVSVQHVHLSQEDVENLFGQGYRLTPIRELQPGYYAAKECVTLAGKRGVLQNVRILGPPRCKTQVEISRSSAYVLGLDPPVRDSGDLEGTPGIVIIGPKAAINLEKGVILARRHIHMPTAIAVEWGLKDGDLVRVRTEGERKVIFDKVRIHVRPGYRLELHVDTDEANAAGLLNDDYVRLIPAGLE